MKLVLVVACALIDKDGRVLIAQRPKNKGMADLWEFPGGKVEAGERPEETLIRELKEELGIDVKEPCLAPLSFASFAYDDFHLLMPLYVCRRWDGFPQALEHQALKWVRPNQLRDYPMEDYNPLIKEITVYEGDTVVKSLTISGLIFSAAVGLFKLDATDVTATYCTGTITPSGDTIPTHTIGAGASIPAGDYAYFITGTVNNSQAKATWFYRIKVLAKQSF